MLRRNKALMRRSSPGFKWRRSKKGFVSISKRVDLRIFSDVRLSLHSKEALRDLEIRWVTRLARELKTGFPNQNLKTSLTGFCSTLPETAQIWSKERMKILMESGAR